MVEVGRKDIFGQNQLLGTKNLLRQELALDLEL